MTKPDLRAEIEAARARYPVDLAEAEDWCRDFLVNGDRYRRDQLDHRWNGEDGRRHRATLQKSRPALLEATVKHVKALAAKLP